MIKNDSNNYLKSPNKFSFIRVCYNIILLFHENIAVLLIPFITNCYIFLINY